MLFRLFGRRVLLLGLGGHGYLGCKIHVFAHQSGILELGEESGRIVLTFTERDQFLLVILHLFLDGFIGCMHIVQAVYVALDHHFYSSVHIIRYQ